MHSGRVDEHDLPSFSSLLLGNVDDSKDAIARSLWFRRNNRKLLADQRIQQRALARIGAPEYANESRMERHEVAANSILYFARLTRVVPLRHGGQF